MAENYSAGQPSRLRCHRFRIFLADNARDANSIMELDRANICHQLCLRHCIGQRVASVPVRLFWPADAPKVRLPIDGKKLSIYILEPDVGQYILVIGIRSADLVCVDDFVFLCGGQWLGANAG